MSHSASRWFSFMNQILTLAASAFLFNVSTALSQTSKSIRSILNTNGSIKATVDQGSFSARGCRMTTAKDGAPGFTPAADPNDKNRDPSFTIAGVGNHANVSAANGDMKYVGGNFVHAGGEPAGDTYVGGSLIGRSINYSDTKKLLFLR